MRIYTKTGDTGQTGLLGGTRVHKDDARIESYGTVDELSAALGLVRASGPSATMAELLLEIQSALFVLGAELASGNAGPPASGTIGAGHVARLEQAIDGYDTELPALRNFILPGGTLTAALLHQARVICRRAERRVVTLARVESVSDHLVPYLNRLSDLLFVLSRTANHEAGVPDIPWRSRPLTPSTGMGEDSPTESPVRD